MAMVRKARCPMCGSAKATPTTSAFIYCDYCGQMMDLDLEAYRKIAPVPSEEYQALDKKLEPAIEAAKQAKNRTELTKLYRQLQILWVRDMAMLYGPRMADQEFRANMIDYLTYQRVFNDLCERLVESAEKLSAANAGFEMVEKNGRWLIKPETLWPIIEEQARCIAVYHEEFPKFPGAVSDPDDTPDAVRQQLGYAGYIAGWMTMIDDATAKELLRRCGLETAYEQVPDPELHQVFCGHCGNKQQRPAGARRVLCETCGKKSDVGHTATCHSCGAKVTIGLGTKAATCEHCKAAVRLAPQLT